MLFRVSTSFSAWTLFSFLCHYAAKQFLKGVGGGLLPSLLLTVAQIITCLILLKHSFRDENKLPHLQHTRSIMALALLCHGCATFATNYSLALLYAPSTLTIKLLEPMMSALLVWAALGKPVSSATFISLILLAVGSLGFVGNPLSSLHLGAGTLLAIISNSFYGLRNILMKQFLKADISLCENMEYLTLTSVGAVSIWICQSNMTTIASLYLLLGSAVCHVIYSYISTNIILQELSVLGHAVANICKRLLVVLLMVAVGEKVLSADKLLWLLVCGAGLALYAYSKHNQSIVQKEAVSKVRQQVVLGVVTSGLFLLLILTCISLRHQLLASTSLTRVDMQHIRREMDTVAKEPIHSGRKLPEGDREWIHAGEKTVSALKKVIGQSQQVVLSHYPLTNSRAHAMDNVGLLYILKSLGSSVIHLPSNKTLDDILLDSNKQVVVILPGSVDTMAALKIYLQHEHVKSVVLFVPSIRGKDGDITPQIKAVQPNAKLQLFCHDNPTASAIEASGLEAQLVPSLALSIPRVYRFMKPLFHYVFMQGEKQEQRGCELIKGESPTVRCDARSWDLNSWATPKGVNEQEDVYLRTYIGYFFLLRGQVVIVDELAGVIAAMLFDIPVVTMATRAPDMEAYLDTWNAHGFSTLQRAATIRQAADMAMEMTHKYKNQLTDFEPGIKIIKSFPY